MRPEAKVNKHVRESEGKPQMYYQVALRLHSDDTTSPPSSERVTPPPEAHVGSLSACVARYVLRRLVKRM